MVSTVFLWHSWVIWASVIIAVHSSACHIHASCSALQSHVETPAAMHSVYCLSIVDPSACFWTLHCATKAVASVLYLCLQGQQVYKSIFTHYPATVLNSFGKPICGIGKHCIFRHALNFYAACKDQHKQVRHKMSGCCSHQFYGNLSQEVINYYTLCLNWHYFMVL